MKKLSMSFNMPIIKVNDKKCMIIDEPIIVEHHLELILNGKNKYEFFCSPFNLKELVLGYLLTSGMIKNKEHILEINFNEENNVCKTNIIIEEIKELNIVTSLTVEIEFIYKIMAKNLNYSETFKKTGGVHSVAIFNKEQEKIIIMEDVARHNAMDKAIGYCVLNNIPLNDKILVASGRVSAEMITKARRSGIPIIISKSAPTSLCIEIANKACITLIGFVRGESMNVYTHPYRVNLDDDIFKQILKHRRKIHLKGIKTINQEV